jgi:hypothetical protein
MPEFAEVGFYRLRRAKIGGRTTCWSPARQKLR